MLKAKHIAYGISCIIACAASPVFADECHIEKQATLPITFNGLIPTIPVTINGHPINIGIDTGAQGTGVTPDIAQSLSLPRDMNNTVQVIGSNGVTETHHAVIDDFEIGGAHFSHQLATVVALPRQAAPGEAQDFTAQVPMTGLIGADILSNYDIEFDVPNKTFTLYRVSNCTALTPPWQGPYVQVPVTVTPTKRLVLPVILDGQHLRALFDTGSSGMRLALSSIGALGVTSDMMAADPTQHSFGTGGQGHTVASHKFDTVIVGREVFHGPRIDILDFPATEADMFIGEDYMHHRRFWLSYATHAVFIQRATPAP